MEKDFLNNNPNWTNAMILVMYCMNNKEYSPELRQYYKNLFDFGLFNAIKIIKKVK